MTALPGKPAANADQNIDANVEPLVSASPGARLRKTRESLHLGVAEAAQSLNLSPGVVKALEADDYRTLPNATFVKGYIRSYARVLGIASEDLVRSYEAITGCDKPKPVITIEPPKTGPKGGPILIVFVVLIVAAALVTFFYVTEDSPGAAERTNPDQPVTQDTAIHPEQSASVVSPDIKVVTVSGQAAGETHAQASAEPASSGMTGNTVEDDGETWIKDDSAEVAGTDTPRSSGSESEISAAEYSSSPAQEVSPQAAVVDTAPPKPQVIPFSELAGSENAASPETEAGAVINGEISMTFTGDCWVEVRDGKGELIYSNLKRLGETLTLDGQVPLEAKLGNGNVVSLSYNGKPVSFRVPSHKVVRVRLGE